MKISYLFANSKVGLKKIGAEIIRDVEETPYCHFAILVDDGFEQWIYEAVFPKSQKIKFEDWLNEYDIHTQFNFNVPSQDKLHECVEFLETLVGKWYAFDQCIWIAFCIWFKINEEIQHKVSFGGRSHLICTEVGYLFSEQFFKFNWSQEQEDRIDLVDMFQIANRIANKTEWI